MLPLAMFSCAGRDGVSGYLPAPQPPSIHKHSKCLSLSLSFLQAYDETTNFSWDAALHILTKLKVEISVCLEIS